MLTDVNAQSYSLFLDGVDDYIRIEDSPDFNLNDFTIEFWIKTNQNSAGVATNYFLLLNKDCDGCESTLGDWNFIYGNSSYYDRPMESMTFVLGVTFVAY